MGSWDIDVEEMRRRVGPTGFTGIHVGDDAFAHVRRVGERYEIEVGWRVPEAYSDDYRSVTYHPLKCGVCAWVGVEWQVDTIELAVTEYNDAVEKLRQRRGSDLSGRGRAIGSVHR